MPGPGTLVGGHLCRFLSCSLYSLTLPPSPACLQSSEKELGPVSLEKPGQLLPIPSGKMRPWSSPHQLGAGTHPTGRGDPSGPRPIPPPRLRRASSQRDTPYPRPVGPALEMVGSKCQLGTPAASLCLADSPSQHRVMPPGPASRVHVSGFVFLWSQGVALKGHENGLSSYSVLYPSPSPPLSASSFLCLSVSVSVSFRCSVTFSLLPL